MSIVSEVQLYVDLYNFPARGQEASEKILEKIKDKWAESLLSKSSNEEAMGEQPIFSAPS
ncbi:MAG: hypothetical protein ACREBS_10835 [Nitrososphaerales archaeon]